METKLSSKVESKLDKLAKCSGEIATHLDQIWSRVQSSQDSSTADSAIAQ